MKHRSLTVWAVLFILLALAAPLFAHHGATRWERDKTATISGQVRQFDWQNPHPLLLFDVKNDAGAVKTWAIEFHPPGIMNRSLGWTRGTFKAGDQIKVFGHPEKPGVSLPSGFKSMRPLKVTFSNGTVHTVDPPGAGKIEQAGGY